MKRIFLTALVASAALTASAQIEIGPRVGLNFASLKASGDAKDAANEAATTKTGYQVGAAFKIKSPALFHLQPEVLYTQVVTGTEVEGEKTTLTANYLQVPVLLGLGVEIADIDVHLHVGPYASFWLSGSQEEDGKEVDIDFGNKELGMNYNRLDAGAMVGVGVGIPAGPGKFNIDLRASQGFTDIQKDTPTEMPKLSNRVYSLSVAYMFGFGL